MFAFILFAWFLWSGKVGGKIKQSGKVREFYVSKSGKTQRVGESQEI